MADGEGVRVSLCSVSKGTQSLLFLLSAVCHCCRALDRHSQVPFYTVFKCRRSFQESPVPAAKAVPGNSPGGSLGQPVGNLCSEVCDAQKFPSEHAATSSDHLLLPQQPGMQLESGKGVGEKLYLPGASGTGLCEKSAKGCCQIQKQQENALVWEAEVGLERCPWGWRMLSWSTDPLQLLAVAPDHGICCCSGRTEHNKPGQRQVQLPHQPLSCLCQNSRSQRNFHAYLPRSIFYSSPIFPSRRSSRVSNTSQQWLTKWVLRANIKVIVFPEKTSSVPKDMLKPEVTQILWVLMM